MKNPSSFGFFGLETLLSCALSHCEQRLKAFVISLIMVNEINREVTP